MDSRQSRSFSGFLFAFIAVIGLAFGLLAWAGTRVPDAQEKIEPVDNIAQPN